MLALFKSLMLLDNYFSSSKVSLFGISEKNMPRVTFEGFFSSLPNLGSNGNRSYN